jgi:hypothetical protein
MTPGRKFSISTSDRSASFTSAVRPAEVLRSRTTLRLPRLSAANPVLSVPARVPICRVGFALGRLHLDHVRAHVA